MMVTNRYVLILVLGFALCHELCAQEVLRMQTYDGAVQGLAITKNGKQYAIAVSPHENIEIRDMSDGKITRKFKRDLGHTTAMSFSSDGKLFAFAIMSEDNEKRPYLAVRIASLDGSYVFDLKGHRADIGSIAVSSDGAHLISGQNDGQVRLWDLKGKKLVQVFNEQTDPVCVGFLEGDKVMTSASRDGSLKIWDVTKRRLIKGFDSVDAGFLIIRSVGNELCAGSLKGELYRWRGAEYEAQDPVRLSGIEARVTAMALSPDCTVAASACGNTAILCNAKTGKLVGKAVHRKGFEVTALAFGADAHTLVTGAVSTGPLIRSEVAVWRFQAKAEE
jgi:WD40 repeat protein